MDDCMIARVAEGVARKEYSLLLGAGASIGSQGGNGTPLPSGPQLRDKLIADFKIPTAGESITLSRAYAAARRNSPKRLDNFIRDWFTGCTPDWQYALSNLNWHRIWTLNIDDIIETVFANRQITLDRFDWTSRYRDKSLSGTQVVHLHGFARESSDTDSLSSDLVFSISDYVATLKDPRAWHTVFTDEFADRPFIILGASLVEEFDLQQALADSAAVSVRGFPSIIVLESVTGLEREELTAHGLEVVQSGARDFIALLQTKVHEYRTRLQDSYGQPPSPEINRFLQQFLDLRQYLPKASVNTRNFYSGYDPHWRNILDGDDALLETTQRSLSVIQEISQQPEAPPAVHVLSGTSGAGKSTGLLRIASKFIAEGKPVFQFRGDEDLDVNATMHWLKRSPDTVLIFNDCADFANSIGELADRCASSKVKLLAIGSERTTRLRILERQIAQEYLHLRSEYVYQFLSDNDIEVLIDKLASKRRLGRITRSTHPQQHRHFARRASRRLFEGMADLEGGQGFRIRIRNDYHRITSRHLKLLHAASSIAYELGYPLPLGISARVAELSVRDLDALLKSDDQDTMVMDSNGVRPPHRLTATLFVQSALSDDDKFDAMQRLVLSLAPHIDIEAIRRLTRLYRLLRQLMNQETVMRLVGAQNGRRLYETMQASYDWNGRYWEQRALFESELGNHTQARSYAEHSLQIHRHPFAFNTLGTILGRIAVQDGNVDTLREAIKNLESARDERRWEASEHPYITFFTSMIRFGETWGLATIPSQIRNTFTVWFNHGKTSRVFASPTGENQLQQFHHAWLDLTT